MNRFEKMHGKPGAKYGIYNKQAKKFQFGICEDTPLLAEERLWQRIGNDAGNRRFMTKRLPDKEM